MKSNTSHHVAEFDQTLILVEELFRRRKTESAVVEFRLISPANFAAVGVSRGLYLSLKCEADLYEVKYSEAIASGSEALTILAPTSLNQRVGRTLWNLSKCFSLLGDLNEAESRARDSISAYRRAEYRPGVVDSLNELAKIASIKSQYPRAVEYLQDALALVDSDNLAKRQQIMSNLGRVRVFTGAWEDAQVALNGALAYDQENQLDLAASRNLLSLGFIQLRQRRFDECEKLFAQAEILVNTNDFVRERLILQEYRGEAAFEKGDFRAARTILTSALDESRKLAPDSSLVTQIGRLLAESQLELGSVEEAGTLAQHTLESSETLGERVEVGLCQVLLARTLSNSPGDPDDPGDPDAVRHFENGIDILREIGDPFELGRALLVSAQVYSTQNSERTRTALLEARRMLEPLGVDFYNAIASRELARLCFDSGDYVQGYPYLRQARQLFENCDARKPLKEIESFLNSVAADAVEMSLSRSNSFNVFGSLSSTGSDVTSSEGGLAALIGDLRERTGADRAVAVSFESDNLRLFSDADLTEAQRRAMVDGFMKLVGEEFSSQKPTMLLDCSRDPYINDLLPTLDSRPVVSVIVTPLFASGKPIGFLYLDRLSPDDTNLFNSFSQDDLNLTVGFSGFFALELAQEQKSFLLEDNIRLKEQMLEKVGFPSIITESKEMIELLARVRQVVDSDISVVITGETGVGKDLLAKAIHYNSVRRDKRFVSVNCAALPETLLESELFGYKRGAFTGADRDKPGLLEEADGGAFFLDEIGDMPLPIQAKILRVLEEKEVVRLGDSTPRKVDVRIISATHCDLQEAMSKGDFRQDLYYRLSALTFRIPPLRERREDIALLINHFSAGSAVRFDSESMQALIGYDWPGNVRELENEVRRLCLICAETGLVTVAELSAKISGRSDSLTGAALSVQWQTAVNGQSQNGDFSLYDFIADHERRFISDALTRCQGVKKHAAALLHIPESTLRLKIKQYDIPVSRAASN